MLNNIPTLSEPYPIPQLPYIYDSSGIITEIDFSNSAEISEKHVKILTDNILFLRKILDNKSKYFQEPSLPDYPKWHCLQIRGAILSQIEILMVEEGNSFSYLYNRWFNFKEVYWIKNWEYFHQWIQMWWYFLDVANDTLNTSNSKIEIKKLQESWMENFSTYQRFCEIAELYWWEKIIPNTLFPSIAHIFPYFSEKDWKIRLERATWNIAIKDIENWFKLWKDFLENNKYKNNKIPEEYIEWLKKVSFIEFEDELEQNNSHNYFIYKWWFKYIKYESATNYKKYINKLFKKIEDEEKIKEIQDKLNNTLNKNLYTKQNHKQNLYFIIN